MSTHFFFFFVAKVNCKKKRTWRIEMLFPVHLGECLFPGCYYFLCRTYVSSTHAGKCEYRYSNCQGSKRRHPLILSRCDATFSLIDKEKE